MSWSAYSGPEVLEERLWRLMNGYLTTQLLYVVAKLGVADVLAEGPQSAEANAERVGAHPPSLSRMLRALVLEDVLEELEEDGRFALTGVGAALREGVPGSFRGPAIARAELYYAGAAGLLQSALDGRPAFEHVHGERFFDHLARDPEREAAFQASMAGRAELEAFAVVAAFDFRSFRRLVDVGGGQGILLRAILEAVPELTAVLVDRPGAVEQASERLAAAGLAGRVECVPGDFFDSVPDGADAYLVSRVLHDWDDADAARILASCHAAMTRESRLLVVEALLPERVHDAPAVIRMDLHMLELLGARERTEGEYHELLAGAGFRVVSVVPTQAGTGLSAGLSVIEAVPAPTPRA
jgi:ubiquinone/menaquinone biosynthesis C-methylase UbiE